MPSSLNDAFRTLDLCADAIERLSEDAARYVEANNWHRDQVTAMEAEVKRLSAEQAYDACTIKFMQEEAARSSAATASAQAEAHRAKTSCERYWEARWRDEAARLAEAVEVLDEIHRHCADNGQTKADRDGPCNANRRTQTVGGS